MSIWRRNGFKNKVYCKSTIVSVALQSLNPDRRRRMIPAQYLGLVEMGFTFVVVAAFTIQQLWSLRDKRPRDDTKPPKD